MLRRRLLRQLRELHPHRRLRRHGRHQHQRLPRRRLADSRPRHRRGDGGSHRQHLRPCLRRQLRLLRQFQHRRRRDLHHHPRPALRLLPGEVQGLQHPSLRHRVLQRRLSGRFGLVDHRHRPHLRHQRLTGQRSRHHRLRHRARRRSHQRGRSPGLRGGQKRAGGRRLQRLLRLLSD